MRGMQFSSLAAEGISKATNSNLSNLKFFVCFGGGGCYRTRVGANSLFVAVRTMPELGDNECLFDSHPRNTKPILFLS